MCLGVWGAEKRRRASCPGWIDPESPREVTGGPGQGRAGDRGGRRGLVHSLHKQRREKPSDRPSVTDRDTGTGGGSEEGSRRQNFLFISNTKQRRSSLQSPHPLPSTFTRPGRIPRRQSFFPDCGSKEWPATGITFD